ncbi:MAG: ABC transporter permease, partial [Bacteroidota bacterium]
LRNLSKKRLFAFINVVGLSIAIACNILIYLFVSDELSYDQFHEQRDRIVRLNRVTYNPDGSFNNSDAFLPAPLGPALVNDMPEVEATVRFLTYEDYYIRNGEQIFLEDVLFADKDFLNMFSFKVLSKNSGSLLQNLNAVLITEDIAEKYFPGENPVGKELEIRLNNVFETFTITALLENIPSNSSVQFSVVIPFEKGIATFDWIKQSLDMWNRAAFPTYALLKEGVSAEQLQEKMLAFRHRYYPDELEELKAGKNWEEGDPVKRNYYVQPITDIHLNTQLQSGMVPPSNPMYSYILLAIGAALLLLACINFTTLTIGQASSRIKEIGIRKVVGAKRGQLIIQLWVESFLMSGLALIVGLVIVALALPEFNTIAQKQLTLTAIFSIKKLVIITGFLLITGLIAGGYPALSFSNFKPLASLKNKIKLGGTNTYTRTLVVIQFAVSLLLVSVTLLMSRQINYMKSKDLGFDKEQLLVINANSLDGYDLIERYRAETVGLPAIVSIAGSATSFTMGNLRRGYDYKGEEKQAYLFEVSANYIETMGMELLEGRNFNPAMASDSTNAMIVNESLVKDLNLSKPIGELLEGFSRGDNPSPAIIGILKDYHFSSLEKAIEPLAITIGSRFGFRHLLVKIAPNKIRETIPQLESIWKNISPDLPFTYYFLDEQMDAQYQNDERWGKIVSYAGIVTILIACLGLFGLTAISASGRTKEMGIRKVLGATVPSIMWLVSREFIRLIAFALVFAALPAWYLSKIWLNNFAYRINIAYDLFLFAGLFILFASAITASYHVIKVSLENPVKSLRDE